MVRNVIGSVLALAGATAAVWSPFRAWYDGRPGSDYRVQDLFEGITLAPAGSATASILLPFAFAALVALVGVLLRSRLLVVLSGLIVIGFTVLWTVRQGQAVGSLTVGGRGPSLGDGVAGALGGGVLLLLAGAVMSGRAPRIEPFDESPPEYQPPGYVPPEYRSPLYPPAEAEPADPYAWEPPPGDTQPLPTTDPNGPRRPRPDPYGAGPAQDPFRPQDPYPYRQPQDPYPYQQPRDPYGPQDPYGDDRQQP